MTNRPRTPAEVRATIRRRSTIDDNGCWNWTGATGAKGYGKVGWAGATYDTHRLSYQLHVGPIPDGKWIDHRCHNRSCNNPDHLRPVTPKQNGENRSTFNAKSGLRGVVHDQQRNRWTVYVKHNGKTINGGRYKTQTEAEHAATSLRLRLFTHSDADKAS